ncbi:MAG: hypothetical protein M3Q65_04370, partial [Chloroflexota bacterium]|nr:hypothetical protein [Chloroflexota bacterium]
MRRDRAEIPIALTLTPLDTPAGRRVLALIRDLTEHRRAEAALREGLTAVGAVAGGQEGSSSRTIRGMAGGIDVPGPT